ncbi:unnamed protein product [Fusarium venenatum]|uniref:Uncharacterized protein n=1 Tax=Fusarium venenatum TaxID=56646 RepID=A0A2L2SZS1_9HYPO|nr:uncharacterized protein FVRRES_04959 [Fusarium venenatum]CEI60523.1 unnamed protein product [Fusarium venenatum]
MDRQPPNTYLETSEHQKIAWVTGLSYYQNRPLETHQTKSIRRSMLPKPEMAKFEDLPAELVNNIIIDRLPRKSLIHITFAQRHIKKLKAAASSPRIAPHVQEIVFFIFKTLPSCKVDGNTDDYIKGYSQAVRYDFFMCVDALPNLRPSAIL